MAGGTWIDQNKVRPGVYINYKSAPASLATMGERGTVTIARRLNWGEKEKFYVINDVSDTEQLGYSITAPEMLFLRQILLGTNRTNGAKKVYVWSLKEKTGSAVAATGSVGDLTITAVNAGSDGNNISVSVVADDTNWVVTTKYKDATVNSQTVAALSALVANDYVQFGGSGSLSAGTATLSGGVSVSSVASATVGNLIATANYAGTYGNRLKIVVIANDDSTFDVQTLLDNQVSDNQNVSAISGLVANDYVSFSGTGALAANAGVQLSGGSDGDVDSTGYQNFRDACTQIKFDIMIYDGSDASEKSNFATFVKSQSNDEGNKCQLVVSNYPSADNECVISVYPQSLTLIDGTVLSAEEVTWWIGGASSGANVYESLTYAAHPDAASVSPKLSSRQQEAAINAGQLAFIEQFEKVQVLTDINSFKTFSVNKGKAFRKNRVVRTVFGLCNDIYRTFALYYIGAVHNDDEGRKALKAEILDLMNKYQGNRALQNVAADDVNVERGVDIDSVVIEIFCQPVDSIEKIYINITIS